MYYTEIKETHFLKTKLHKLIKLWINIDHIISLCEANIEKTINSTPNDTYKDYKIEHTKMSSTTNNSKNAIIIRNNLVYTRRYDLEDDMTSTIWIELRIPDGNNV